VGHAGVGFGYGDLAGGFLFTIKKPVVRSSRLFLIPIQLRRFNVASFAATMPR